MKKYTRTTNSIFNLGYHIIWCPKYRKNFLLNLNQQFLLHTFHIAAIKVQGHIENINIMPDHIFIRLKQNHISISKMVQILKGYSSYIIRKKYNFMKKYKALWSPSYFIESIGNMSEHVIKKYINNQKINVKPSYKYIDKIINIYNSEKTEKEQNSCKKNKRRFTMYFKQFEIS